MWHIFRHQGCEVVFEFLGLGDGYNFSRKFAPEAADKNTARLLLSLGATSSARILVEQGYDAVASPGCRDVRIDSAALVTTYRNDALLLMPADCIPIILMSTRQQALALIHGGRRELDAGIIQKTIELIGATAGVQSNDLVAYLGPGIKQASYRLPLEVLATLKHSSWQHCIRHDGDNIFPDLFGFARHELIRLGVHATAITESAIDTATDPDYFSYYGYTRLGQPAGANGCVVMLRTTPGTSKHV